MDDPLAKQYEAYPYPARNPDKEYPGKTITMANDLKTISHYLHGGKASFSGFFKALVAGGGTGDATVHLSEQLAKINPDAEVIHLDLSASSIDIARRRIKKLNLTNVQFIQGSLLGLESLGLGHYDYINCSGVLHHLENPLAGVRALKKALKPDGGMSIMLYGKLGRLGIYHTQEQISMLRKENDSLEYLIDLTQSLLRVLPPGNWLSKGGGVNPNQHPSEIVDMFLHVRDRAYCVHEILALLRDAEIKLVSFIPPLSYDPTFGMEANVLRNRIDALPREEKFIFAELLYGGPAKHIFFAIPEECTNHTVADPSDFNLVPTPIVDLELPSKPGDEIRLYGDRLTILKDIASVMLCAIDGVRSTSDIFAFLVKNKAYHMDQEQYIKVWYGVYHVLNGLNKLVLVHKNH